MGLSAQHCSFVLLAEFDIDRGAQLTYQFPQPLGTDEGCVCFADCAPVDRISPFYDSHPSNVKALGQLDVARWRREAPGGLDHFLFESNALQYDRAGARIGIAR